MKEMRVLAILPYEELLANVQNIAGSYPGLFIDCHIGNLKNGLDIARRELAGADYDVILSRGGTAELLKRELPSIPVMEINISFEDVFYAVMLARNYRENFAVVSFPFLTKQVHTLCELLDFNITIHNIHSEEEAKTTVQRLHKQGYTMIVGDVITAQMAREVGMNFVLIMSGRASIRDSLDNISCMLPLKYGTLNMSRQFSDIVSHSPYMHMIMDDSHRILYSSFRETEEETREEERQGSNQGQDIFKTFFMENIERIAERLPAKRVCRIGRTFYQVYICRDEDPNDNKYYIYGEKLFGQDLSDSGGIKLVRDVMDEGYAFHNLHGAINSIGQTRESIYNCSRSPLPILILGEEGTGKDAAAGSIYRRSTQSDNPYFVIDCEITSDREWYRFFNRTTSPLMHANCTIHFKNAHRISHQNERRLKNLIEESMLCRRNKVIFSATAGSEKDITPFVKYIRDDLQSILLHTLPIRERRDDLKNILVIYLNELNIQFGKQIIGFEEAAEKEILNYQWPGNITQLKRVFRELVTVTDTPYITEDNVKTYIRNEIFSRSDQPVSYNINLDQSLDDITYDVICAIMRQENMNQSNAAKRLGIGRTTIWRILKSHNGDQPQGSKGAK